MAYTKIIVIHNRLDTCVNYARDEKKTSLAAALDYAMNRDKTEKTCFESGVNCDPETAYQDMTDTKRRWGKENRVRRGYHIIQSFVPGEVTPEEAHAVGVEFASRLFGDRYEVLVCTHLNKAHLHNHIVVNSVSFVDGKMYLDRLEDYYGGDGVGIRGTSDAVCREHGLSVIEPDPDRPDKRKSRPEWEGKTTIRDSVRRDIDAALAVGYTLKTFWAELERMGYAVKRGPNVKHTAVKIPGGTRFLRLDSLGDGYTEADIKTRLTAARDGNPPPDAPPPVTVLYGTLEPGRRYRVSRGILSRARRLKGFRALTYKYLYLLGGVQRHGPGRRPVLSTREELIRFDRYKAQFAYLTKRRIETPEQLAMQADAIQAAMDALTDRRRELYRLRRAGQDGGGVSDGIAAATGQLRALRRELKLCARIEGDVPKIRGAVAEQAKDRSVTHEKTDKSKFERDIKARPSLSPRADRER